MLDKTRRMQFIGFFPPKSLDDNRPRFVFEQK